MLVIFDLMVILLLQCKLQLKSSKRLEDDVKKLVFKTVAMVAILDFQMAQF